MDFPPGVWHVSSSNQTSQRRSGDRSGESVVGNIQIPGASFRVLCDGAPRPKWIPKLNCPPVREVGRDDTRNRLETTSTPMLEANDGKVHVAVHQKRKVQYRPAGPLKPKVMKTDLDVVQQIRLPSTRNVSDSKLWVPEAESLRQFLMAKLASFSLYRGKPACSAALRECAQLLHACGVGIDDLGPFSLLSARSYGDVKMVQFMVMESSLLQCRCGRQTVAKSWRSPSTFVVAVTMREFCNIVNEGEIQSSQFLAWGRKVVPPHQSPMAEVLACAAQDLRNKSCCLIFGSCSGHVWCETGESLSPPADAHHKTCQSVQNQLVQRLCINRDFYQLSGFALKLGEADDDFY